ncbi:MAG: GTP 3',8-cyclase MoaA [Anaerolineaceae bacterium]
MSIDRFGRNIHYLRISLTDVCNFRCVYCMSEDTVFRPRAELMTDEELVKLVRLFARMGFDKLRLTGGEPTVRPNIPGLVREMSAIAGINSISMTTNGYLLEKLAVDLKNAGLQRVNISLDTLEPERFKKIARRGSLDQVWRGILAAEEAGLLPVKLNTVVARDFNDMDTPDLAGLTLDHPWQVRFIEMMPFADVTGIQQGAVVKAAEIMQRISQVHGPLEEVNGGKLDGEARLFHLKGARGEVGFISSVSAPFCSACTRARLTADGKLRLCLLRENEVDLLTPLRQGASEEDLRQVIVGGIWNKPWGHGLAEGDVPLNRAMNEIGG